MYKFVVLFSVKDWLKDLLSMIEIVPYTPTWPTDFATIATMLRAALGPLALRIDHIGSTSVPGLAAKDIIDVQVTVADFVEFAPIQTAFESLDCTRREITRDHRPPGTTGPDSEWEKRYFQPPPAWRRTHLHVRAAGRANQRYPLLFRDYLRAHPRSALAYAALKQQLAHYHGHSDDHAPYVEIKDPVCDLIIAAAEDWAIATSWEIGVSDG
jgi:GrpB-like predicted nucleotidyltransferase (UPF0157 family)